MSSRRNSARGTERLSSATQLTGVTTALATCCKSRGWRHANQLASTVHRYDHAHSTKPRYTPVRLVPSVPRYCGCVPDKPRNHHHGHVADEEDDEGGHRATRKWSDRPNLPVAGQLRIPLEPIPVSTGKIEGPVGSGTGSKTPPPKYAGGRCSSRSRLVQVNVT